MNIQPNGTTWMNKFLTSTDRNYHNSVEYQISAIENDLNLVK